MNKRKLTKICAVACALALTVTASHLEPFSKMFKTNNIVVEAVGEAGGTGGNSGGSSTSTLNKGWCITGDVTGYRIYLAPNRVWIRDASDVGVNTASVGLLDDYHNMALYELSCHNGARGSGCACTINEDRGTLNEFYVGNIQRPDGSFYKDLYTRKVEQKRILSRGASANENPTFAELFEGISGDEIPQTVNLHPWGSFRSISWDFGNLAEWSNERFMHIGDRAEGITKFLQNYKRVIADNNLWNDMEYPDSYDEFIDKNWCIIVEPICTIAETDSSNSYALSFQDYLGLELGDVKDNGISNSSGTDMTQFDFFVGGGTWDHYSNRMFNKYGQYQAHTFTKDGMNRFAMMAAYYADFWFEQGNGEEAHISTAPKYIASVQGNSQAQLKYISSNLMQASTAGFAVYTDFSGGILSGTSTTQGSQNYMIIPSTEYTYANPESDIQLGMFELPTGDGQLQRGEKFYTGGIVLQSDLLAKGAIVSNLNNQHIKSEDDATALSDDISSLAAMTGWGGTTYSAVYPNIKFFNTVSSDSSWRDQTSLKDKDANAISPDESMITASNQIVGGEQSDSDYYLKTFYANTYNYNVSKAGVDIEYLKSKLRDGTFQFYIYPNAVTSVVDNSTLYAGSKFTTGVVNGYVNAINKRNGAVSENDTGLVFTGSNSLVAAPKYSLVKDSSNLSGDSAWQFATELSMYALANSNISAKANKEGTSLTKSVKSRQNSVSDSVEIMFKDTKVSSYLSFGGKDKEGNIYSGRYVTLNEQGDMSFTDKPMQRFDYSVVDTTDVSVIPVDNKSQNGKPVFVIAIPNSEKGRNGAIGAFGYDLSEKAESHFYEDFYAVLKSDLGVTTINSVVGVNRVAYALNAMGIDKDKCVIKLAASGNDVTRVALGAYGGCNGDPTALMGYSIYVLEDCEVAEPVDCEGTLHAYELNYVYPTILCETTDADLVTFYVSDANGEVNITKTNDYSGGIISYNNLNKITLLDMIGTKFEFDNEQTDPKVFTYDMMQYKNISTENVDYKRGYSYLTHSVNLTRGNFGDAPVISSLASRDAALSAEYLEKMGVTVGNKGRDTEGNSGEFLLGSNFDTFRWSASKGLPIMLNGQLVEVTPFGDGQPMQSAGYNLTTKGYAYIANDRDIGDLVNTGIVPNSLVVPNEGTLTYKILTAEEYDDIIKFYPEHKMVSYVFDESVTDGESADEARQSYVYVMADKIRRVKASGLYSIAVGNTANAISGKTTSDTIATGSAAKKLSEKFNNLQVVYAGGNINLSANTNFDIDLSGFVLDQIDKSKDETNIISSQGVVSYTSIIADNSYIKQTWGNDAYDSLTQYQEWVNEIKSAIGVDMSLTTYNGNNAVRKYTGFNTNVGKITGGEVTGYTTYALTFKNGAVVADNAYNSLIKAFAMKQFDTDTPTAAQIEEAAEIFANSEIFASIISSVESSTDEDNKSSAPTAFNNRKWYDEEVRSFVIRQYHTTPIKIENVLVSDKIDINAGPSQTGSTAADLFKNGYVAKWGMTVYLKNAISTAPSMIAYNPTKNNLNAALSSGSVIANNVVISGADFVISDATTSDARN